MAAARLNAELHDTTPRGLSCPSCGSSRLKVHKNKPAKENAQIRIRICKDCGQRFSTRETLD